jgi:ribonuclease R
LLVHRVIKAILGKSKYVCQTCPHRVRRTPNSKRLEKNLASRVAEPGQKPRKLSADMQAWQAAGTALQRQ